MKTLPSLKNKDHQKILHPALTKDPTHPDWVKNVFEGKEEPGASLETVFNRYALSGLFGIFLLVLLREKIISAGGFPIVELILVSSGLVLVPLGIKAHIERNLNDECFESLHTFLKYIYPIAMGSFFLSAFTDIGMLSGSFSLIWVAFSLFVFWLGLKSLLARGLHLTADTFIDLGFLSLSIGTAWYAASRLGLEPMGYSPLIVALTAIHFHIAGFGASVLVGQAGRILKGKVYLISGMIICMAPIMVAIGKLTFPFMEVTMACLLAVGIVTLAFLMLRFYLSVSIKKEHGRVKAGLTLLTFSMAVSFLTMVLAGVFAFGNYSGEFYLTDLEMIPFHGIVNFFCFMMPSFFAFELLRDHFKVSSNTLLLQNLKGLRFIGNHYFDNTTEPDCRLNGIFENFTKTFKLGELSPKIINYFENTAQMRLFCKAQWLPGFQFLSHCVHKVGEASGQLVIPRNGQSTEIKTFLRRPTGRSQASPDSVACIRTYEDGSPLYLSSFLWHESEEKTFMNICLPVALGSINIIYEATLLEGHGKGRALCLTSRGINQLKTGIWFKLGSMRIKLPVTGQLDFWDAGINALGDQIKASLLTHSSTQACHAFWFFGIPCLQLNYVITDDASTFGKEHIFTD